MSFTRRAWAAEDDTILHEISTTRRYPVSERKIGVTVVAAMGPPSVITALAGSLTTDTVACVRTATRDTWYLEREGGKRVRKNDSVHTEAYQQFWVAFGLGEKEVTW